jgi:hypothetical protein
MVYCRRLVRPIPLPSHPAPIAGSGAIGFLFFLESKEGGLASLSSEVVNKAWEKVTHKVLIFLCPVALHTALNRFMPIFQIALILRAV